MTLPNSKSTALARLGRQTLYLEFQLPRIGRGYPRFGVGVAPNFFRSVKNDWLELHRPYINVSLKFASQKKGAWPSRPCGDWSACSPRIGANEAHRRDAPLQKIQKKAAFGIRIFS
jgi:hypothetical protein